MWASAVSSSFTKVKRVTEIKITILQKAGHRFQVTENLYVPILKSNELNKSEQRIDEISNQELFMHVFYAIFFPCINRLALLSLMSSFEETIAIFFCLMIHCQIDRFLFLLLEKNLVEFWWFFFCFPGLWFMSDWLDW